MSEPGEGRRESTQRKLRSIRGRNPHPPGAARRAPPSPAVRERGFDAAGFDSMSLVKLLLHIETKYGRWIPESEITNEALANVRSLAAAVARVMEAI